MVVGERPGCVQMRLLWPGFSSGLYSVRLYVMSVWLIIFVGAQHGAAKSGKFWINGVAINTRGRPQQRRLPRLRRAVRGEQRLITLRQRPINSRQWPPGVHQGRLPPMFCDVWMGFCRSVGRRSLDVHALPPSLPAMLYRAHRRPARLARGSARSRGEHGSVRRLLENHL